jgi:hypothetical protein
MTSPGFAEESGMDVSCWETAEILVSGGFRTKSEVMIVDSPR